MLQRELASPIHLIMSYWSYILKKSINRAWVKFRRLGNKKQKPFQSEPTDAIYIVSRIEELNEEENSSLAEVLERRKNFEDRYRAHARLLGECEEDIDSYIVWAKRSIPKYQLPTVA